MNDKDLYPQGPPLHCQGPFGALQSTVPPSGVQTQASSPTPNQEAICDKALGCLGSKASLSLSSHPRKMRTFSKEDTFQGVEGPSSVSLSSGGRSSSSSAARLDLRGTCPNPLMVYASKDCQGKRLPLATNKPILLGETSSHSSSPTEQPLPHQSSLPLISSRGDEGGQDQHSVRHAAETGLGKCGKLISEDSTKGQGFQDKTAAGEVSGTATWETDLDTGGVRFIRAKKQTTPTFGHTTAV